MKKLGFIFILTVFLAQSTPILADGMPEDLAPPVKKHVTRKKKAPKPVAVEEPTPAPIPFIPPGKKINLVSWNPDQKAGKIVGSLQEGVSTMWDVLRVLAGPNTITLSYPEEKEMWGYLWLWSYDLKNPIEDTVVMMDQAGKRIKKGDNPVELYITFNKDDRVAKIEMDLIKKKKNKQVVSY